MVAQSPGAGHEREMDALAILRLQLEWGADEALDETPVDRLRPAQAAPIAIVPGGVAPVAVSARARASTPAAAPEGTPAERALRAAGLAGSLEALKAAIAGFDGCALRDMATNLVFATGDADSGLLLIGGPPGADEDRAGAPFAGREGTLLDQMLRSIDLRREAMLLAPLIPWRPPGGRVPTPGEIQVCRPFLMRLIALTAPRRIVLFGALAASTLLATGQRARRSVWFDASIEGGTTQVLILPALAELWKTPSRRKEAWAGMRALRRALDG
jgi:uracil-DNA glycosylase family 4